MLTLSEVPIMPSQLLSLLFPHFYLYNFPEFNIYINWDMPRSGIAASCDIHTFNTNRYHQTLSQSEYQVTIVSSL
jgi:hypothetical protein